MKKIAIFCFIVFFISQCPGNGLTKGKTIIEEKWTFEKWKGESEKKDEWKEIEKLIAEEKFESASKKVSILLEDAKKKGDSEEWTRTLVKQVQLRMAMREYETSVRFLKQEEWPSGILSQTILNLFYAKTLVDYYLNYSWEINHREKVESVEIVDLKMWTGDQIYNEAQAAYEKVWKNREKLGEEPVGILKEYISPNNYPSHIRGTLRDAVSYLYIELLSDTTLWRIEHYNEEYLLNLKELINGAILKAPPSLTDPDVHPLIKLCFILDDLKKWHESSNRVEASFEAYLRKLRALYESFTDEEDREIIKKSLEENLQKVKSFQWWAKGMAQLASYVQEEDTPDNLIRALKIAKECYKAYPDSIGGKECLYIMKSIEAPNFEIKAMLSDGANKNSIEILHKNLSKLYFRAYRLNLIKEIEESKGYKPLSDTRDSIVFKKKPLKEWEVFLPETSDYKMHKTFIKPPLKDFGLYVIGASAKKDFSTNNNKILSVNFILTDLVLVTQESSESVFNVTVLSGKTGFPVANVKVSLYQYHWRDKHKRVETKITDFRGDVSFEYKKARKYYKYFLVAKKGKDVTIDLKYYDFKRPSEEREKTATLIYTDRSIYRPMQKIQWKVIVYKGKAGEGNFKIKPSAEVTVKLFDPNDHVVESKIVTTNKFGSASGEFNIPSGRLLGRWYIQTSPDGYAHIQVEEYKRPTFEVSIVEPATELRLNEPATFTGKAIYYFGLPVTAGTVKWKVERQLSYLWEWRNYFSEFSPNTRIIASGTSNLKEDGTFEITFTPLADEKIRKKLKHISYDFSLDVDITDEGGETRTVSRSFRLGFVSVEARIYLPQFFRNGEDASIKILRTNLEGVALQGKGKWRLVALKQPEKTLLPYEQPLLRKLNEDKEIPYQTQGDKLRARWDTEYSPESVMSQWEDGEEIVKGEIVHNEKGESRITLQKLKAGAYRLYYETKDKFGEKFSTAKEIIVADKKIPLALPLILKVEVYRVPVGKKAYLLVHSGFPKQVLILNIFRSAKLIEKKYFNTKNMSAIIEIPVEEKHRGGFGVSVFAVRDHQFMKLYDSVFVPWDNKELELEFSTFRDKVRPGAKETFKVKVKAEKSDESLHKNTELLAYMYDKSLDFFDSHSPPYILSLYPRHNKVTEKVGSSLGVSYSNLVECEGFKPPPEYPILKGDKLEIDPSYGISEPDEIGTGTFFGYGCLSALIPEEKSKIRVELRSKFEETAFFKPHLLLEPDGSASIEFIVPDSVTAWNLYVHAVTKDLKSVSIVKEVKSVKDLMVRLYAPRFLREGDYAEIKVVVNNASDNEIKGNLSFDIIDPENNKSIISEFGLKENHLKKSFTVKAGGGTNFSFPIRVPKKVGIIALKAIGLSSQWSDGEIRPIALLPGRIHLAQSRFVTLKNKDRRTMTFKDLEKNG